MSQIYISTLAFKGKSPEAIIEIAKERNWSIEFTSSFPYIANIQDIYLNAPINRLAHNYFPPPQIPFVLNLASADEIIRNRSIEHCLNGLNICKKSDAPFFAAHAGFCVDPQPSQLGHKIAINGRIDREKHREIFISSLSTILEKASMLRVPFLIENNVIIDENITTSGENPLLCCENQEIRWLFSRINSPYLGLLLDTAHLKVSCNTLGIDKAIEIKHIKRFVGAIHHSDNDGLKDNNQPLQMNYWFLPYMKEFKNLTQVIEVRDIELKQIQEQINLLSDYGS